MKEAGRATASTGAGSGTRPGRAAPKKLQPLWQNILQAIISNAVEGSITPCNKTAREKSRQVKNGKARCKWCGSEGKVAGRWIYDIIV